jgi:secreted PhoX family phosphatase
MPTAVSRRRLLQTGALAAGALAMGPAYWRQALAASPTTPGVGPYGPLGAPDRFGIALPEGFRARLVAATGSPVEGTGYFWPLFPDGKATFRQPDGGWVLCVNSEVPAVGGASSISFDRDGRITGARRILGGTSTNCGGGATPWGTWLSCEEVDEGRVWECDPLGVQDAVVRPAMGVFTHEAAAVDPVGKRLYMTEDDGAGGFYRFTPARYPDLSEGVLEIATPGTGNVVRWVRLPDPQATGGTPTRAQIPESLKFKRGEGLWFDTGVVYFSTTSDDRIWAYECASERLELLYDGKALGDAAPLRDPDQLNAHPASGDLYVCEDADDLQVVLITQEREVAPFVQLSGPLHPRSGELATELAGTTFDPDGQRLYFSSQRGGVGGMTFEVTGPFRSIQPRRPLLPAALEAAAGVALALRAKPAAQLATLRRDGLLVSLDADAPGRFALRLQVRTAGRTVTIARGSATAKAAGNVKARLRVPAAARDDLRRLRGRRVDAQLVATRGTQRVTRPIVLTRGR